MHFCYVAVVGLIAETPTPPTGKLLTLGTTEVMSIAGLQGTKTNKTGRRKKKIQKKGKRKKKINVEHGQ